MPGYSNIGYNPEAEITSSGYGESVPNFGKHLLSVSGGSNLYNGNAIHIELPFRRNLSCTRRLDFIWDSGLCWSAPCSVAVSFRPPRDNCFWIAPTRSSLRSVLRDPHRIDVDDLTLIIWTGAS